MHSPFFKSCCYQPSALPRLLVVARCRPRPTYRRQPKASIQLIRHVRRTAQNWMPISGKTRQLAPLGAGSLTEDGCLVGIPPVMNNPTKARMESTERAVRRPTSLAASLFSRIALEARGAT
jgi:hypothetical protein